MIHRHRGNRRLLNVRKAIRKQRKSKEVYLIEWYNNLHQYFKNKIHCSCSLCAEKTNNRHLNMATTKHRNKKNWKHSDLKRMCYDE